jgi:cation transport protein ChaC
VAPTAHLPGRRGEGLWAVLTRERIRSGWVQEMVRTSGVQGVLDEGELVASRAACLAGRPASGEIWVFGYGSLIWNPCFHFVERRVVTVAGWHRRFCLWTSLGRGTQERPGLMLGLERGGACRGVAFRLAPEAVECELDIVWRREMVTSAYRPAWVRARSAAEPLWAIAFTINRRHPRYAGRLEEARIVEAIATARGPLGPCSEYLFNTVAHLDELGVPDRRLHALCRAVRARQAAAAVPEEALAAARGEARAG